MHIFRTQLAKSKVKDVTKAVVYACSDFTPWQRNALEFLQTRFNAEVCGVRAYHSVPEDPFARFVGWSEPMLTSACLSHICVVELPCVDDASLHKERAE